MSRVRLARKLMWIALPLALIVGLSIPMAARSVSALSGEGTLAATQSPVITPSAMQVIVTPTLQLTSTLPGTITSTVLGDSAKEIQTTPVVSNSNSLQMIVSLGELEYDEKALYSPNDAVEYELRLPEGWILGEQSTFELDFSYQYVGKDTTGDQKNPSLLGTVTVAKGNNTLRRFSLQESSVDHFLLSVPLPPSIFQNSSNNVYIIKITFDASSICDIPHDAYLTIHSSSFFVLNYEPGPIVLDLARYPRPFYQRTFESDRVSFVLPDSPSQLELEGAASVAARLGNLTYGLAISGTTDMELESRLTSSTVFSDHLILIGRPDNNAIILDLAQQGLLPVSLQERQSSLSSIGPVAVAPDNVFTYTLVLTRTDSTHSPTTLLDVLPGGIPMVSCTPVCSQTTQNQIAWAVPSLAIGESATFAVTMYASRNLTDSIVENVVTVLDANSLPINGNTISTVITSAQVHSDLYSLVSEPGSYFFSLDGRIVPEQDGIIQEVVSPWDQARAVLILTGLSENAVYKACQAMGTGNHFPAMEGRYALVQQVLSLSDVETPSESVDRTFGDLGYDDRMLRGLSQQSYYYFTIPVGWQLTQAAYLDLHFSHSQLLDYQNSSLTVMLNGEPIATVAFSDETSQDGRLRIGLASESVSGQENHLSLVAKMMSLNHCANLDAWVIIKRDSVIHLDHQEVQSPIPSLGQYPYPFNQQPALKDILFVLPSDPQIVEWESMLQVVASLGQASDGTSFAPALAFGNDVHGTQFVDELARYHILVIGRPSRNLLLQEINDRLPQPFLPYSDMIEQKLSQVVLRLPSEISLGYVQLIVSPWNDRRVLVAVTGTTDEGVKWATDVWANQSWSLAGNLVLIRQDAVQALDTRQLTRNGIVTKISTAVPEMVTATMTLPVSQETLTATIQTTGTPGLGSVDLTRTPYAGASTTGPTMPQWLLPFVGVMAVLILAIIGIAVWQRRRA